MGHNWDNLFICLTCRGQIIWINFEHSTWFGDPETINLDFRGVRSDHHLFTLLGRAFIKKDFIYPGRQSCIATEAWGLMDVTVGATTLFFVH